MRDNWFNNQCLSNNLIGPIEQACNTGSTAKVIPHTKIAQLKHLFYRGLGLLHGISDAEAWVLGTIVFQ